MKLLIYLEKKDLKSNKIKIKIKIIKFNNDTLFINIQLFM